MSYIKRAYISQERKDMTNDYAERTQKDENKNMVSPNGTKKIITDKTKVDIGHQHSFESRYEVEFSEKAGLTQSQHNELFTNPGTFQIEPHDENISHQYENKDHNDAMQNVSAYAYSQDSTIAANTYINPSEDGNSGTISVINAETGEESTVCSYNLSEDDNTNTDIADETIDIDANIDDDTDAL